MNRRNFFNVLTRGTVGICSALVASAAKIIDVPEVLQQPGDFADRFLAHLKGRKDTATTHSLIAGTSEFLSLRKDAGEVVDWTIKLSEGESDGHGFRNRIVLYVRFSKENLVYHLFTVEQIVIGNEVEYQVKSGGDLPNSSGRVAETGKSTRL